MIAFRKLAINTWPSLAVTVLILLIRLSFMKNTSAA